jgi:hypothetical protein
VRYFFRRRIPLSPRILLVESGSRRPLERALPALRAYFGEPLTIDVLTCYKGFPAGLRAETSAIFDVNDYRGARRRLLRELRRNKYAVMGMLCSGEPILTKWKWTLAASLPAKVFVVNENGDLFWLDYAHGPAIRQFAKYRAGFAGSSVVHAAFEILRFPFVFLYLLLYATAAHLRRALRRGIQ